MRTLAKLIFLAPLALACPPPAFAQSTASPDAAVAVPSTTTGTTTADRETYVQTTRDDLSAWRGKLDAFAANAKGSASEAGSAADRALHSAWTEFQVASDHLESVGADGWSVAKSSYEKASEDLSAAWRKVRPEQL
jgi:hypothetical protein